MHDSEAVLRMRDLPLASARRLCHRYGMRLSQLPGGAPIRGSYWGAPEAGVVGCTVYVRDDTPVHSFLHELCHLVCMTPPRRAALAGDAGGDDAEECAVCYLQVLLADELPGTGRRRLMRDMDAWGYSFRLGSAARWFADDAEDALQWLVVRGLLTPGGHPTWRSRPDGPAGPTGADGRLAVRPVSDL